MSEKIKKFLKLDRWQYESDLKPFLDCVQVNKARNYFSCNDKSRTRDYLTFRFGSDKLEATNKRRTTTTSTKI